MIVHRELKRKVGYKRIYVHLGSFTRDASDEQKAAAFDFVKWITAPEQSAKWTIATGYVAPRAETWETETMKAYSLDIEQLTYVKTSENLSNFQAFAAVVQPQLLTGGRLQDEKKGITPSWEVKRLTLRLRTLKETDRSQQPPLIRKMPVAIEHNFQSVNDIQSIIIPLHRSLASFNATRTLDAFISALTTPRKLPMASGSPYSFDNVLPKALDGWQNIRRVLQEPLEVPSGFDTP